jgi:hypothetical protein
MPHEDFFRFLEEDKEASKLFGTQPSVIPTANSQQPTANSQQPTANSQQPTAQTTREKFEQMIYKCGVFESQAKAIMDYAIPKVDEQMEKMGIAHKVDWSGRADGYPDVFYPATFQMSIKPFVVEWIDANIPQAWFRTMFTQ